MRRIKLICQYSPKNRFSTSNPERGIDQGGHLGFNYIDTKNNYFNKNGKRYKMDPNRSWETETEWVTGFFIKLKYKD